ncbi:hypothetical protein [Ideonella paludis]|uniref:hypothetical protein n=1 Tax=Ideonella paludis TaxID=1233411 RepID=UPI0036431E04
MSDIRWITTQERPAGIVEAVDAGLDQHNLRHAPLQQVQPLVCAAQDDNGATLGAWSAAPGASAPRSSRSGSMRPCAAAASGGA